MIFCHCPVIMIQTALAATRVCGGLWVVASGVTWGSVLWIKYEDRIADKRVIIVLVLGVKVRPIDVRQN